ncbi:MAG: type II toxin-antitoxin system VapC family toxin [Gammaproteobacteria bacterium]
MRPHANTTFVLDASAVLAYLQQEPGMHAVHDALQGGSAISTVNLAEVCAKLKGRGLAPRPIMERLKALGLEATAFTEEDAMLSGEMVSTTRPLGLALGDRACLALCRRLSVTALTTEKVWAELNLGFEVRVIR